MRNNSFKIGHKCRKYSFGHTKEWVLLGLVLFYFYLLIAGLLLTDLSNVSNVRQLNYTNIIFKR